MADDLARRARGPWWWRLFLVVAARREPRMDADEIMQKWRVGSADWSWTDEIIDIFEREGDQFWRFFDTITAEGVRVPVLLGNDGRVWDGHHRIIAAYYAGVDVPVEYAGKRRPVEWVRGWRR